MGADAPAAEEREALMQTNTILQGDALELAKTLPDNSIHCIVTSPPYWGLRNYDVEGQLGLEPTPEAYIEKMVTLFRELRRALHPSGCLWLNLGDSYSSGLGEKGQADGGKMNGNSSRPESGLPPKNMVAIPWRVTLALQADGWYLRSDIIWSKPNPMPESVTDRPTKAHEYIFLLTKSARYFFDAEAVREAHTEIDRRGYGGVAYNGKYQQEFGKDKNSGRQYLGQHPNGRNRRTVWTVATQPYAEAHFATFPPKLIEPCVLAGSSAKGVCPEPGCGNPWERVVDSEIVYTQKTHNPPKYGDNGQFQHQAANRHRDGHRGGYKSSTTTGWRPTCDHDHEPIPATVFDPFLGSGTTAQVAIQHHRAWLGFELNAEYIKLAEKRLGKVQLALVME